MSVKSLPEDIQAFSKRSVRAASKRFHRRWQQHRFRKRREQLSGLIADPTRKNVAVPGTAMPMEWALKEIAFQNRKFRCGQNFQKVI